VAREGSPCGGTREGAGGSMNSGSRSSSRWPSGAGSRNGGGEVEGVPEWQWWHQEAPAR
jgi:hypothetical protein